MTVKKHKQLHLVASKATGGAPSEDDLALINSYALVELGAGDVYMRTMYLAHNGIDRDGDVFDSALLDDFVKTLPGKGLFIKHPMSYDGDSGPGEGRFIRAQKVTMAQDEARKVLREPNLRFANDDDAELLEATFYIVRTDENTSLLKKIDGGIAADVSIGFSAADVTLIKDGDDNVIAYRLHAPGQAYEGSLVWLGAQPGARIYKQASLIDDEHEDELMDYEKEFKALQAKHDGVVTELEKLKGSDTQLTELKAALGDHADDIAGLIEQAALGKQYRDSLVDDAVTAARKAGLIEGDDDKTIAEEKAFFDGWDIDRLKAYTAKAEAMAPAGEQLNGGDPNATGADAGAGKTADPNSPLNNKAVTG